jgi:N-formylglutamate amidohydrolase
MIKPPFVAFDGPGSVIATAIHAGHSLRPEISDLMRLDGPTRLREEDPYTEILTEAVPPRVVVDRSRFEVDLNRPRHEAVYLTSEQAWGLELWRVPPSPSTLDASLRIHDRFYAEMAMRLDVYAATGPFVVLDIHSYNHRRHGPEGAPADGEANPDLNLGTGSLDRSMWGGLVDHFLLDVSPAMPAESTVAENVRFKGGYFSNWVNERYRGLGCCLALEFKKTFMDEWTGEVDLSHLERLRMALASTIPGIVNELGRLR